LEKPNLSGRASFGQICCLTADGRAGSLPARRARSSYPWRPRPRTGEVVRTSAQPYLSLIVPAFNEAGRIRSTLTDYHNFLSHQSYTYEIIVWADGTDGTREIVAEMAARDRRIKVRGGPERGRRAAASTSTRWPLGR